MTIADANIVVFRLLNIKKIFPLEALRCLYVLAYNLVIAIVANADRTIKNVEPRVTLCMG